MQQENIRYIPIWSSWLRLSHWVIAFGVIFQITSAWAIKLDDLNVAYWLDWHIISGQIIGLALVLRVVLLFFPGSSNWRALFPEKSQLQAMIQMVKFYLSLARFPLPNWYAHNPIWLPIYPVFYLILGGCTISGLLFNSAQMVFGKTMFELHGSLSSLIVIFVIFHIVAVFLHDLKGKGGTISAMINGHRYFHYTGSDDGLSGKTAGQHPDIKVDQFTDNQTVSVDSIKKQLSDK